MALRQLTILAGLVLALTAPAQADFRTGMEAFRRHDYLSAYEAWKPLAQTGDSTAQVRLGELYLHGDGVAKDYVEALHWFRQAAEQNNRYAFFYLGKMYELGLEVRLDMFESAKWYRRAAEAFHPYAEQGDAEAQFVLGRIYQEGVTGELDRAKALKLLRAAAEKDYAPAKWRLKDFYEYRIGGPNDIKSFAKLLRKMAEWGALRHSSNWAFFMKKGTELNKEFERPPSGTKKPPNKAIQKPSAVLIGSTYRSPKQ